MLKTAVAKFKEYYPGLKGKITKNTVRTLNNGKRSSPRSARRLSPALVWQQDGATAHWAASEMQLLDELGFCIDDGTILVRESNVLSERKWPARSPDMNWMDQYAWGFMVTEMRYMAINSKKGLKRAIKKVWKEKITTEFCQNAITNFWKSGGAPGGENACPWWTWTGKGRRRREDRGPVHLRGARRARRGHQAERRSSLVRRHGPKRNASRVSNVCRYLPVPGTRYRQGAMEFPYLKIRTYFFENRQRIGDFENRALPEFSKRTA